MKKIVVVLCFIMISLSLMSIVNAEDYPERLIFETEEITDLTVLYQRAKTGISDLIEDQHEIMYLAINSYGYIDKDIETKTYSTTQKIRTVENNETTTDFYVTNIFADTSFIATTRSADYWSYSPTKTDPSVSVRANNTIYWYESISGGICVACCYSVRGSWTILDSQVSVTDMSIEGTAAGLKASPPIYQTETTYKQYPTSISGMSVTTYFDEYDRNYAPTFKCITEAWLHRGDSQPWKLSATAYVTAYYSTHSYGIY